MTRALLALALFTAPAAADTPSDRPTAVELDRDDRPPGRTELGFDGGAPVPGWGVTGWVGWLDEPLTLPSPDGDTVPVRHRQTFGFGGAVALGPAAVVDGRFAVAHQVGDRLRPLDPRRLDRFVAGDLALGARVRVVGDPERAVFVRGDFTLPTGDDHDFAGEASWTLAWRLIGRYTLPGSRAVLAASAGIRYRGREVIVADKLVGNELLGAIGVAMPMPPVRPLWCVSDQVKLTAELAAVVGDDVGMGRGPSPAEARVGVVTRPLPSLTFGFRVGVGLRDQVGAPRFRALVELTYQGGWQLIPPVAVEAADGD